MDPLSITAASVGLALKIGAAIHEVQKFMLHVRESRMEMDRISQELGSVKFALEMPAHDAKFPNVIIPPAIGNILKNLEEVLCRLEKTLSRYNQERVVVKVKYVWSGREAMADQRSSLAAHRDALHLAIDLMTVSLVRETKALVHEVHENTEDIKQDTERILAGIENLQTTLPRLVQDPNDRTGFMLNRYLDELTDYTPTVAGEFDSGSDSDLTTEQILETEATQGTDINVPVRYIPRIAAKSESSGPITMPMSAKEATQGTGSDVPVRNLPAAAVEIKSSNSTTKLASRPEATQSTIIDAPVRNIPAAAMESKRSTEARPQMTKEENGIDQVSFELISLESTRAKSWRQDIYKLINEDNVDVGPKNGKFYRKGVDYEIRDQAIFRIPDDNIPIVWGYKHKGLEEWHQKWKDSVQSHKALARWMQWIRKATMSGRWVNSEIADMGTGVRSSYPHAMRFSTIYPIALALKMHDKFWLDRLLDLGANVTVVYKRYTHWRMKLPISVLTAALLWNVATARQMVRAGAVPRGDEELEDCLEVFEGNEVDGFAHGLLEDRTVAHLLHVMQFLVESGAKPNTAPCMAFRSAIVLGLIDVVRLFLQNGVKVTYAWSLKGTPLHIAIKFDQWDIAYMLVYEWHASAFQKATVWAPRRNPGQNEHARSSGSRGGSRERIVSQVLAILLPEGQKFMNSIEYAAYWGELDKLNKVLYTSYEVSEPPSGRDSKALDAPKQLKVKQLKVSQPSKSSESKPKRWNLAERFLKYPPKHLEGP